MIAVSAAVKISLLVLISEGKRETSDWTKGLDIDVAKLRCRERRALIAPFVRNDWFDIENCIQLTESGIMTEGCMSVFVEYDDAFAKRHLEK